MIFVGKYIFLKYKQPKLLFLQKDEVVEPVMIRPPPPAYETAWERGLRQAKEMRRWNRLQKFKFDMYFFASARQLILLNGCKENKNLNINVDVNFIIIYQMFMLVTHYTKYQVIKTYT